MCGRSSPSLSLSDVAAFRGTGLLFLYFHLNIWTSGGKEAQRDDQLSFHVKIMFFQLRTRNTKVTPGKGKTLLKNLMPTPCIYLTTHAGDVCLCKTQAQASTTKNF